VTPGYFEAAGIRLVRGRDFAASDLSGAPVAIVNQAFARAYLDGLDPLGQRIAFGRSAEGTNWRSIIGVVSDEKQDGLATLVKPEVYDPHSEDAPNRMSIVMRTTSDPMNFVAAVRREVAALDPTIAIYELRTLEEVVHLSLAAERFTLLALGAFASAALVLATVGLYGIVAFTVGQRRREIGVRLALGARRADVLRMVVWDGLRLVIPGLAIGAFLAVLVSRSLSAFLFEIGPADPLVLAGVATLLGLAGALACYVPARRASLIDPALSLRAE
jgi:predicted permease